MSHGAPSADVLKAAWERALGFWALAVHADVPRLDPEFPAIAAIDLNTRVVTLNPKRIEKLRAWPSLDAILVHELGHHVRHPHTLATLARLETLERSLLGERPSLLNLFTDLLINTELGRDKALQDQLVAVYRGMGFDAKAAAADPVFAFHLLCHEEAYRGTPGQLLGDALGPFEKSFTGARAEAQRLVEQLPNLAPNVFTQFVLYASVVSRYLPPDPPTKKAVVYDPFAGDLPAPGAGEYADALEPGQLEKDALDRARREGWLGGVLKDPAKDQTPMTPGRLAGDPKLLAETMAVKYRRLAEKHLVKPEPEERRGDAFLKTTLVDWEDGDAPQEIDWVATLATRGPELGVAMPLKRELEPDLPGFEEPFVDVRLEIYLDVSGSMPDPKARLNPMTLAAQVLALSAFRAKGVARGLIYSGSHIDRWEWTRSEAAFSVFLMNYIGGGTTFPFDMLERSLGECGSRQPVRVVLTDSDFWWNLTNGSPAPSKKPKSAPVTREWDVVVRAAARSACVVMLNGTNGSEEWVRTLATSGARVVPVGSMEQFPAVAARLGEALFGAESRTGARR